MNVMNVVFLVPCCAGAVLAFAAFQIIRILRQSEGTKEMREISKEIREGAKTYLSRQYKSICIFFVLMLIIITPLSLFGYMPVFSPAVFVTGGVLSGLSGYIGMSIATQANCRTTEACKKGINSGLKIAFSAGSVMGLVVVGLALLGISAWYFGLRWYYLARGVSGEVLASKLAVTILAFSFGASSMALFARVGGGIYTKAADVGADLVGKLEVGMPEDDPRNPAVIADQVGDNVGDVAGMGADLYESYAGSIIASMALSVAAFSENLYAGFTLPMVIAGAGAVAAIVGILMVRTREEFGYRGLLRAMRRGTMTSAILMAVLSLFAILFTLGREYMGLWFSTLAGLIAGILMGFNTEYFTSAEYQPTRRISASSQTGPATVIIEGLSTGMLSSLFPVVTVACATLLSYMLASTYCPTGPNPALGLYGIGISAVGMLSTLGVTLASDAYGPVADNAGGIAEFTHQNPEVRKRTDALDSLGNTTAATGKGFAIGSAALTVLALIITFKDRVVEVIGAKSVELSLLDPELIVGLLIGGMIPFLFSALILRGVGKSAERIVGEVRRQIKQIEGLLEGKGKPEYTKCIDITTRGAQRQMILPTLIAFLVPIAVGLLVGVSAIAGLLVGSLVSGFALAVFLANSGGAWDNAKKYVEVGNLGGKESEAHKAAVIGDTVGDPCKDAAGPSLNILLKLMSMTAIIFASFIISFSLF
jgi:K(+)-stimulated pyrophosphate-energized sodium pump